jgi:rRNA-processing protein FCF1
MLEKNKLPVSKKNMLRIVMDANFFFIPIQFKLDIFEELANLLPQRFEPIILSSTKQELEGLAKSNIKISKQALLALKFAEKCSFISVKKDPMETYDDVIVNIATEWKCFVATNDRELRKKLRKKRIPVIFLRQKGRLEIDGAV